MIVDSFAGGGGASTGIEQATGQPVDVAINHDPEAIAMHKANHPHTKHFCESTWVVDPREATGGKQIELAWFSPDCTHFSKAKGSRPVDKNIRGLAWVVVRWAATVKPRVIMLENVEEFQEWGPLLQSGKPDPKRKGRTFKSFVNALKRQGYHVDFRELRACDYGAPTSRNRFFMVARCDNQPVRWPEPTYGDPESPAVRAGKLKPWRTAAEILNWNRPCPSIFETAEEIKAKYGLRAVRPLADKTMGRIAKGVQKFVIDSPKPFVLPNSTAAFLIQYHSYHGDGLRGRGQEVTKPLLTIDTNPRYALVFSHLIKLKGSNIGQPITEPLQTITAGGLHFGEVRTFLTHYYGASVGSKTTEPLPTVVSRDKFGLVVVAGLPHQIADIGMRMLEPRELFDAQGFPPDYIIDRDYKGKRYPKTAQVATRCRRRLQKS